MPTLSELAGFGAGTSPLGLLSGAVDERTRYYANIVRGLLDNPAALVDQLRAQNAENVRERARGIQDTRSVMPQVADPAKQVAFDEAMNVGLLGIMAPKKLERGAPSDGGYVYHATNQENLFDIAASGKLKTFKPSHGTDQLRWPDGAIEKRAYFSKDAGNIYQFAPEHGQPVLLRTKLDSRFIKESTGDMYSKHPLNAKTLEFWGDDGAWHPLSELK